MFDGSVLIDGSTARTRSLFRAANPAGGFEIEPPFCEAGDGEVDRACRLAAKAFDAFRETSPSDRAAFLETIASNVAALGSPLIERAGLETGLPVTRLEGELARTVNQLRLFAEVTRRGEWLDLVLDAPDPSRVPLPRPDLRRRQVGLGPVAIFGASNFPLAFSVAGGDTASALAAGCPVVVKGHPAHPGTGEMVGRAVQAAIALCGMPAGVFALLPGTTHELGAALVAHPCIEAVGFTGSRQGGLALVAVAAARLRPIPVFAEMSSVNPVILLPAALRNSAAKLGTGFVASLTQGAGQFCTNPGLVLAIDSPALDKFVDSAAQALRASSPAHMLTSGIHRSYERDVEALARLPSVTTVARGCVGEGVNQASGALFTVDAEAFLSDPALSQEVFGSSSVVVRCADVEEIGRVLSGMEGQLTATVHLDEEDEPLARDLLPTLERRAGRILANGWPTGVEVAHAMVHGGPFPATSDGRSTAVGSGAIGRFLRPVCYQDIPDALLPAALRDDNPLRLPRVVDGRRT